MTTNTSALPALPHTANTRTVTERFNALLRNLYNKILPVGAANTVLTSDGTTFSWVAPGAGAITNTGATTFLQADVAVTSANTFINGPNTGALVAGTYLISGLASILNNGGGAASGTARISNGSGDIIDSITSVPSGFFGSIALQIVVVIGSSTTFTLQYTDNVGASLTTLKATVTNGGTKLATSITAVRLA